MRNTFYYSQANHAVTVGNRVIEDFAEGDAISWEDNTPEAVAVTEGLDGARISFGAGRAGKVTIKLKPTSPTINYLNYLISMQKAGIAAMLPVAITSGVNEVVKLINCGVQRGGAATGGTAMSEREFSFIGETLICPID